MDEPFNFCVYRAVACRELKVSIAVYLRYVVPRALVGAIPPLALLLWIKVRIDLEHFAGFIAAGVAMAFLFGLVWVFFVYRRDPYVDLAPRLVRRAWSRA